MFSRGGSTVVTMKPKISCYAYRSQNQVEACILNWCSNWKDARLSVYISFWKHDSLKYHQGENAEEKKVKKNNSMWLTENNFVQAFGFSRDKKYHLVPLVLDGFLHQTSFKYAAPALIYLSIFIPVSIIMTIKMSVKSKVYINKSTYEVEVKIPT